MEIIMDEDETLVAPTGYDQAIAQAWSQADDDTEEVVRYRRVSIVSVGLAALLLALVGTLVWLGVVLYREESKAPTPAPTTPAATPSTSQAPPVPSSSG
jgi:hypothetical protein